MPPVGDGQSCSSEMEQWRSVHANICLVECIVIFVLVTDLKCTRHLDAVTQDKSVPSASTSLGKVRLGANGEVYGTARRV